MELFFEIMEGDLRGDKTPVREGLTIGRQGCDLNLRDSKVSAKHAKVERRADGELYIVDLGSSNAIKTDQGKVRELLLEPGAVFIIGRIQIQVVAANAQMFMESTQPEILVDDVIVSAPAPRGWRDLVSKILGRARKQSRPDVRAIEPFGPLVKLKVERGLQAGTEWTVGYGPREVGAASMDLPLFEAGLPDRCFRLSPVGKDVMIAVSDTAKGQVLVNGIEIGNALLESGDEIDIGETRIKISLDYA